MTVFGFRLIMTGEAQQLPNIEPKFHEVRFSTPSTNSDVVYLGNSPVNVEGSSYRFGIPANRHFPLKVSDLSELWAYGTADDILDMVAEVEGENNE